MLGPVVQYHGQLGAEGILHDSFLHGGAHLAAQGQREREADYLIIEEGRTYFQGVGHAHQVNLGECVVRQNQIYFIDNQVFRAVS